MFGLPQLVLSTGKVVFSSKYKTVTIVKCVCKVASHEISQAMQAGLILILWKTEEIQQAAVPAL